MKNEMQYEDKVTQVLDQIHGKKEEYKKIQKELDELQKPSKQTHEELVRVQEEHAALKRKLISSKTRKPETINHEEKTLANEIEKLSKIIKNEENRTKFYMKRLENDYKSTMETIEKTRDEVERKEKLNHELTMQIKEQQQKIREEVMKEKERIEKLR